MSRLVIGTVQGIEGEATVVHADGTVETLQSGARVFADDAISTQQNALVNIEFLDGSILNIGPQYTAVLGKEVFDWTGTVLAAQIADTVPGITPAEPITHIGAVVAADGDAMVIRADGRAHALEHGDLLYANDIIKVGSDGHASIMMLDGSFMTFGPESFARLDDDLFPSRYPDYISSGITDAATIRAAILAGQDPADVTPAPAAGATSESEDVGNSFVVLERTGRTVTPESGHETTGPTEAFGEITEELLPPPIGGEPVISIASADGVGATVVEGGTLVFSVVLDKPNPVADISATWTLDPGSATSDDFPEGTVFTGTVTILAGDTSATIEIPTLDDALFEGGPGTFEDVSLTLGEISNALPGIVTVSGLIEDNDTPPIVNLTAVDGVGAAAIEGNTLVFAVELDKPNPVADISATWTLDPGSATSDDFPEGTVFTGTVTILAGDTSATIEIPTLDDALFEGGPGTFEDVSLTLGEISNALPGIVTVSGLIEDNDTPPIVNLTAVDGVGAAAIEGNTLVFAVELDKPNPVADISATWTLDPGSATSDDFPEGTVFTGTVTILAGDTSATIEIPTLDDALFEGGPGTFEDVSLTLGEISNALPGIVTVSGLIEDNDTPPIVNLTAVDGVGAAAIEGNTLVFAVELDKPNPVADISATWTLDPGSATSDDFPEGTVFTGTVTILAGDTSATIEIPTLDDALFEGGPGTFEDVSLTLGEISNALPGIVTVSGLIEDNDTPPIVNLTAVDGVGAAAIEGNTLVFAVELDKPNPVADISATWTLDPGSATSDDFPEGTVFTGTVTILAGDTSATIEIPTLDDALFEGGPGTFEDVSLTLGEISNALPGIVTVSGLIEDNDTPPIVNLTAVDGVGAAAIEGNTLVFAVELDKPNPVADISATWTLDPGSATSDDFPEGTVFTGTVTILAGDTSATIEIPTLDDALFEGGPGTFEDVSLTLGEISNALPGIVTVSGLIEDNDTPPIVNLTAVDGVGAAAIEGNTLVFAVELDKPNPVADISATWTLDPGSATSDDFPEGTVFTGTVTILAGDTSATIEIPTLDDALFEGGPGTFEDVSLTLGEISNALPGIVTVSGLIEDNDTPPIVNLTAVDGVGAAAIEGNTLVFAVELDKPNPVADISATWTLDPGSATSDDFPEGTVFTGTVTILAGDTSATIEIPTLDDALFEGGPGTFEDVSLTLGEISNALPGIVTVSGLIEDNDTPPIVNLTAVDGVGAAAIEGNTLVFAVELDKPNPVADISATWTLDPGSATSDDFPEGTVFTGTVTILAGDTSATIEIPTLDDALFEGGPGTFEDVSLTLGEISNALPGIVTVSGLIEDNDILVTDDLFGQVTEAALFDGPGGNDDGSQEDPAQPTVNTVDSGNLTFAGGELTGVSFDSGPAGDGVDDSMSNDEQFILEARDGGTVLWRLTVDKVDGVTPDGQIGDYNFELFNNIDHPLDNLAFGDDVLEVQFSYTVNSPGGSESGSLTIDINDDRPDTVQVVADVGDAPIVTNLVVVLDRSGSMNNHPGGDTSAPTRLELAKAAIADLLSAWSELGMVNVMVVDFANSATHATDGATNDPWLTADQANIYVQGITANSVTNYQLAAEEVISLFPGGSDPGAGTPPEADQSYVYWLTDGLPNRGNLNESSWTDFLLREDFTAAYGVGVGRDISAMDDDLQEVAWPNDTEFSAVNPDGNLIVVGDAGDLGVTLVSTVVNRVEGNIVDEGLPDSTFGADGPGLLVSLSVDGITYTYDPAGDGTITPDDGGSAIAGSILSVDTPLGGNLIFDFSSGDYSYAIPQVTGVESETFTYSVVDAEGDQTATPNEFIIRVHEVDEVINGTASSDILTGGAGDELIIGRGGDDTINGGDGSDAIRGGPGSDNLTGGSGADTFIFRSLSEGVDTILDYNSDESDVLDISDILAGFEPGVDTIEDFVNVATDGTLAVNPNPSEPGSSFTDIAVLANISPGTTIIVQVTEDATETYMVMS